jgi:hypothetical protein
MSIPSNHLKTYLSTLPGLVAYLPLNFRKSTTTAFNYLRGGSSNYNANVVSCTSVKGLNGTAIRCNGLTSTLNFPNATLGTGSHTIGLFIRFIGSIDTNDRIWDNTTAATQDGLSWIIDGSKQIASITRNAGITTGDIRTTTAPTLNTWYFLCATYDLATTTKKFFVNGIKIGSDSTGDITDTGVVPTLMSKSGGGSSFTQGDIQHFFWGNTALDESIITKITNLSRVV